jgi:hypothetical protein
MPFSFLTYRWTLVLIGFSLLIVPLYGQSNSEVNLKGAIDFHSHQGPDIVDTAIDSDDMARLAKKMGMRGVVMKNHYEDTAALVYILRKEIPGIELFGGITQDGRVNLDDVKHMVAMKGGGGRVVWFTTSEAARAADPKKTGQFVRVSENGHLLPSVLELIDFIAQHDAVVLETDSILPDEVDMVVHEAHQRGVKHIVVEHEMSDHFRLTTPQMQTAAKDGAFIMFLYSQILGANQAEMIKDYVAAIRAIGPKSCILGTDSTTKQPLLAPQALLDFMVALHKAGISVADINLIAKTNPALILGLQP